MLAFYITAHRTDDDKLSLLCLFLANNLHLNYKRRITHKTKMAITSESSHVHIEKIGVRRSPTIRTILSPDSLSAFLLKSNFTFEKQFYF